ncbi:MAG: PDZ domain-containing protein [Bacteroidota bacterium]
MKILLLIPVFLCYFQLTQAQISAKLMRYMDVSDDKIVFVYGGDIWLVEKEGGTAMQITHSPGEESYPRFSPDGKTIAYTASYQGNMDVYTLPLSGGVPQRLTYHSGADRMLDWHPDGDKILFASSREMGQRRGRHFYEVAATGGMPTKLPIPYGELASYSPDGDYLAYITKYTEGYPFKRYRGGLASDILIYNAKTKKVENITDNHATDGKPSWGKDELYFLSDKGDEIRLNIYAYNPKNKETRRLTNFKDFDISFLSAGPDELIFEAGGQLYLMDMDTDKYRPIEVNVISDLSNEIAQRKDVSRNIQNMTASPEGKRIVFEARGELFNVPVKEGYTLNLTQSSGAFDRHPAWSPDGKHLAYWSDKSGEFEIYLQKTDDTRTEKQLTKRGSGYGYQIHWSPDSKQIAFVDEKNDITIVNVESGNSYVATNTVWNLGHGQRNGWTMDWSNDSRWLTYSYAPNKNANDAIFVYDTEEKKEHQLTSAFYNDYRPAFSKDGKYLYFLTDRNLSPHYSDLGDGTWVYPNATQIAVMALTNDAEDLFKAKSDVYEVAIQESPDDDDKTDESPEQDEKTEESSDDEESEQDDVKIEPTDAEARIRILPIDAGNFYALMPFEGKLVFAKGSNTGSEKREVSLMVFDWKKQEAMPVISGIGGATVTADGKAILVSSKGKYGIIKPAPKQKIEKPIPIDGLVMNLVPKEEWNQLFNDAWRRHRDFFYDPDMHGVDWDAMRKQYGDLIEDARTRWDVSFLISNLSAELSAGHTYTFGGDAERVKPVSTGLLGIDWGMKDGKYIVKEIIKPAVWDTEMRSPLDRPGMDIEEGDFIHSVNGVSLTDAQTPYAAFNGLSGKTVTLQVSKDGNVDNAKSYTIDLLTPGQESQLRYLAWIEHNRQMVDELSDGKLGYVYMSNTAGRGQLELVRMYYGQLQKEGFIIDERFNGGGQLADRFLELMTRPVVYNLHWRHGKDHTHPIKTNTGPMGMLINGWAGSGGDGLPWAFQELKAGPIVGERTLGILVGPATGHQLIDGGGITVPGARLYDNDGHWFWEGEGVAPDIEVWDDPNILMQGRDPQMERVVKEVMEMLDDAPKMTPKPPSEDRTAEGLNGKG